MAKRPSSADTARRLVALVGHLKKGAVLRISDLAEEVGVSEAVLASDLETLSVCGVAPYYPDDYIPLVIQNGLVYVSGEVPALRGPVRLGAGESRALASALQAAGFTADDELTARLMAAAAPADFDAEELERTIRSATATHQSETYGALARGIQGNGVVRIEYVRAGTEESSCREVEPATLFAERGAWYLTAWCRSSDDWRTFRVDRIRSAGLTGDVFTPREGAPSGAEAFRSEGLPAATLRFTDGERFDEREWPGGRVTSTSDAETIAEVPYGGTEWIARRVVARLGRVEVVEPQSVRAAVRELAAQLSS